MRSRNRKKRSKPRAEYLQKQDDILSQENKAKIIPSALQGRSRKEEGLCTRQLQADPEKKKASVRDSYKPIPKRSRPLYATATRPIPKRRKPLYATATRPIPKRRRPLCATATTQILNLSNLLKGSDIKRTSRRTTLLKGRNTRTIQLPLRHLKGIGIGMTPLSDWLNVLPRGSGIAGVIEPPKGM